MTYRLGASSLNSPSRLIACRGRIHVLNCCSGSSLSSTRSQRFHSDSGKSALLKLEALGQSKRKGRESSSNLEGRLLTHPCPLSTLAAFRKSPNSLIWPVVFVRVAL